jgi:hypothetical protein
MEDLNTLGLFMDRVQHDPRIGPMHISLYMAIIFTWAQQGRPEKVRVTSSDLKPLAKIAGRAPFYRCVKQLHAYGYIVYEPSFDPVEKSRIYLPKVER